MLITVCGNLDLLSEERRSGIFAQVPRLTYPTLLLTSFLQLTTIMHITNSYS